MASFGTAWGLVREDAASAKAVPWDVIGHRLQGAGVERAGDAVRSVGTAVEERLEVDAGDLSVLCHARTKPHEDWMSAAMAIEDLLAREGEFHGPVEKERSLRRDDLMAERVALAAEPAAVGRRDYSDVRGRHRQDLGEGEVDVVRGLCGGIDDQLAVRIGETDGRVLLERQMRAALEEEDV